MAKHSKRNRRRLQQSGLGGGMSVVRRVPLRLQRTLPQAPSLSPALSRCRVRQSPGGGAGTIRTT